jgi:FHS family L-fucose permease-like MFS transporter
LGPAPSNTSTPSFAVESPIETDRRAMTVATALFFMVGLITCLNDVIISHLKTIFELTYAEAMLVQFAFFSSYLVFSYPGGKRTLRRRIRKTVLDFWRVSITGNAGETTF